MKAAIGRPLPSDDEETSETSIPMEKGYLLDLITFSMSIFGIVHGKRPTVLGVWSRLFAFGRGP